MAVVVSRLRVSGLRRGATIWTAKSAAARTFASVGLKEKRVAQAAKIDALPEVKRRAEFREQLAAGACNVHDAGGPKYKDVGLIDKDVNLALEAGLATFHLHIESRITNFVGESFYTIGPCGEELLSGVALALNDDDAVALHYRHLSTSLTRNLRSGKALEDVLLDRARGYCVSSMDPVGRGHHCLLGGGATDFLVTSTLASQSCPAVGRAAGLRLAKSIGLQASESPLPASAVSYVSLGDGSVNNSHFLSAANLSEYMQHRKFQCPVVFGISDNGVCISLKGNGWLRNFVAQRLGGMEVFWADANSLADVYQASAKATEHARRRRAPAVVIFENISRRFGHAATDRQDAYLTSEEIMAAEMKNSLAGECARAVEQGVTTYAHLLQRFDEISAKAEAAFNAASLEPKCQSRDDLLRFNSQPLVPKAEAKALTASIATKAGNPSQGGSKAPKVMRANMTRVLDELLASRKELVYIGEDVEHGGYYRVTEGLRAKYGLRVSDFPPDETSLLGMAIGYSQAGLMPIVELPYAKYLDCGADMFYEAIVANWLSGGKQPAGMVIRLQGFDKGVFGGNFHTHNILSLPPGLDVVAYSNGADYVRGLRHAVVQAAAGRVVMLVDSTDLLNRRHLGEKDDAWMRPYPADSDDIMTFDDVTSYGEGSELVIVSYGNGVPTALRAKKRLEEEHGMQGIVVVDAPCLSHVPQGLSDILPKFKAALFADVCKMGQHPHAGFVVQLQNSGKLPKNWRSVAASPTYNPLGSAITFLSEEDIIAGALAAVA